MNRTQTVNLAIGRIYGMLLRAERPGDVAEYERCRALILDLVEVGPDRSISFARDYGKGAQGQW